nr:reverse transcriptase domain-containing protein [Tanacetum cinerariifolium]
MNTEQTPLSQPTSAVRNTLGREQAPQNLVRPVPDEDPREYCDKNYHQILPIIPEKLHQEKKKEPQGKVGTQGCPNQIHKPITEARPFQIAKGEGSGEKDGVQKIGEKSYYSSRREAESCYQSSRSKETEIASEKHRYKREYSRKTKAESESEGSAGGHWKSKPKKQKSSMEDDLSQPWVCEETDPFTPRICYFDFSKTQMPSHIKTYNGSEDPEDHLKIFQAATKTERWAMPTWCHMFNSTLTGNAKVWFDDLPKEFIDSYDDLKKAFLENYLQQKNASKIRWKSITLSKEMGNPRKSCGNPKDIVCTAYMLTEALPRKSYIVASKDRRRGTLNIRSNEFHGGEITFSLQRDYRKAGDMTGVPRHIVEHRLNVREGYLPLRQKKRGQAPERNKAISEEVRTLVEAGIMKEVHYHSWLSNPVMVKKHDNSWRMCVDFKDLNKACPKDDAVWTKNAGATYQRLVDKAFQKQIGRNLEVYMDDLVIKSRTEEEVIRDAEETFKTHRKIYMKLDPEKCAFGMRKGTFLGYKVDANGLRVSPDKRKAVIDLPSPKCLKDVQKLNEKLRFELEEHDIQYRPRTSVKGQILADFIVERPEDGTPDTPMKDRKELPDPWILFTNGSSCVDGSGAGLIIMNPKGMEFTYALRFRFNATNNEAEYEALIVGLQIASQMGIQNLQANVDSKLVANQVNGIYIAKESSMVRYLEKAKNLASTFKGFSIKQIPRGENKKADALSKITSTSFAHLSKQVLVEELGEKEIDEKEILAVVEEEGHTWMTPVYEYLTEGVLPEEKKKARTVRRKAGRYAIISEVLYKKSFLGPWLQCVGPLQANYVLREIHEGSCSMHAGPSSVVAKALRLGYFWPTMHTDTKNLIRKCKDCQVHRPAPKNPQEKLTPITSPWPFYKWGIDIAGPFPKGPDKVKFLIVAIDYFTKLIEAKPVASITRTQVKKFVWDNIVCRFGLLGEVISDNEK